MNTCPALACVIATSVISRDRDPTSWPESVPTRKTINIFYVVDLGEVKPGMGAGVRNVRFPHFCRFCRFTLCINWTSFNRWTVQAGQGSPMVM